MSSVHQRAQQIAMRLLPKSKRQLAQRIAKQRVVVLKAKKRRKEADNPKERLLATRDLLAEAKTLHRMVKGAEKAGRGPVVEELSADQALVRKKAVLAALKQTGQALSRVRTMLRKRTKPATKRRLVLQFQMLQARKQLLLRRLKLLQRNQDVEQGPLVLPSQVSIQRVRLSLPSVYEVPTPGELIVLTRLIAAALTRNPGETDRTFRARLRAYTKRATVRFLAKRRQLNANDALVAAAEETINVDAPAIEAEADAGGFVLDPVSEAVAPLLETIADEIDGTVADIQSELDADVDESDVDDILAEAETAEADLASSPPEVQDELFGESLLPQDESPGREDSRVDALAPSGADEAPAPLSPVTTPEVQSVLDELDAAATVAFDEFESGLDEAGVDTDHVFAAVKTRAAKLDAKLRDRTEDKVTLKKAAIGALFVVGVVYLLTRSN